MRSLLRRVPLAATAIATIVVAIISVLMIGPNSDPALAADETIEVWWPTEGANLSGTQPFKALFTGKDLDQYRMYWQVDGGAMNEMSDNHEDSPHKESLVDLSKWPGEGSYRVKFVATNRGGKKLAQRTITIYVTREAASQSPTAKVSVSWPSEDAQISGVQPFKAVLDGAELADYRMFWQVDGEQLHAMADSLEDHPHKEASVDVSDWTWDGPGPYEVTFVAKSPSGSVLATTTISLFVDASEGNTTATTTAPTTTTSTAPITTTTTAPTTTTSTAPTTTTTAQPAASGLVGATLYVDTGSPARAKAEAMRDNHPYEASLLDKIAGQPTAKWFGDWNGDIFAAVDQATDAITAAGAVPVYVAYNIPMRDCSGYSAGGSQSADAYRSWIQSFAQGIGSRTAAVVLEPDALTLLDCLSEDLRAERLSLFRYAIQTFDAGGSTTVYLDAGHARWHSPEETASRLEAAGVEEARGFALNVSNFVTTQETVAYGEKVSALLGGTPFVVDTARNGLGPAPDGEWCNPSGTALGRRPVTRTGNPAVDAYLWVKVPGESDGTCNGGPAAGVFWTEYALGLSERADW